MVSRLTALAPLTTPAGAGTEWMLQAADGSIPTAAIDMYESATITARYNAVSAWELTLPTHTDGCQALLTADRPRLLISSGVGEVFRSGPPIDYTREITDDGDMTTITGVDDLAWLRRRLAHPQPASSAPPYSTNAYDIRTGNVSTVIAAYVNANAGPGAVAARRVPDLTIETPAALGPSITHQLRYHNLLDAMVGLADGYGLGIDIVDMVFHVFEPTGSARFSVELGTLAGSESAFTAPDANYLYIGGGGEGTARTIVEASDADSVGQWGRFEDFVDRRDTTNPAQLTAEGTIRLAETVLPPTAEMEAVNTEGQQFGVDWTLGSVATVWLDPDAEPVEQVIREVVVELRGNTPASIRPTLGGAIDMALWKRLATTNTRIRQLEVR